MSGGYESSSSSEDSFTPVEDLHVCSYDLEPMTSSDGEGVKEHVDPFSLHISVKNISSLSRNKMSRFNPWMEENKLYRYFKAMALKEDDLKMCPKAMRNYLSSEHPKIYESLLKLDNGEFFIYLGKSLVVTLNIDNSRIRIPTSLIFDACIFSVNQPVVVISVFQENTNVSRRNMYNTFLARGVTEALRSHSCENVSVKKGAITLDCNVHEAVHKLQQESTDFENTSLFTMSKSKAENLVEALLRTTAVASTYLVVNPKEDTNVVWFLSIEEFEFLTEFIDMTSIKKIHTITGDKNLIALEMLTRLGKRHKTVLLLSSIDANLTRAHFEGHKNITVLEAPDEKMTSKYSFIITDQLLRTPIKGIRKSNIIFVSTSISDRGPRLASPSMSNLQNFVRGRKQISLYRRCSSLSERYQPQRRSLQALSQQAQMQMKNTQKIKIKLPSSPVDDGLSYSREPIRSKNPVDETESPASTISQESSGYGDSLDCDEDTDHDSVSIIATEEQKEQGKRNPHYRHTAWY